MASGNLLMDILIDIQISANKWEFLQLCGPGLGLVFIMLDEPEEKRDTAISNHILNSHRIGGMIQNKERAKNPTFSESDLKEAD